MAETGRRPAKRRRLTPLLVSGAAHAALLTAIFLVQPGKAPPPEPELVPIPVMLAPPPPEPPAPEPEPKPKPPAPKAPAPAPKKAPEKKPPPPPRVVARIKPAPPEVTPLPAAKVAGYGYTEASDAQVSGAATAEGGGGGSGGGAGCNMARRLQTALRKDRMAQAAMTEAHRGKPIMMWNGAWVRHPSQEGEGLAAVREAILWEVGFAPEACRKEQVRGMVLISMNDGPGAARLMVGSGQWRWADLLFTRGVVRR